MDIFREVGENGVAIDHIKGIALERRHRPRVDQLESREFVRFLAELDHLGEAVYPPEVFTLHVFEEESDDPSPTAAEIQNRPTPLERAYVPLKKPFEELVGVESLPECTVTRPAGETTLDLLIGQTREESPQFRELTASLRIEPKPFLFSEGTQEGLQRRNGANSRSDQPFHFPKPAESCKLPSDSRCGRVDNAHVFSSPRFSDKIYDLGEKKS